MSGPLEGQLSANTRYAFWVENGTQPHVIRARNAKALRFVQNGAVRFATEVHHPGTAPRPFMQHARDVGERSLDYGIEYLVGEAIKRTG